MPKLDLPTKKLLLTKTFMYEVGMLWGTFVRLETHISDDVVRNSLIEAFSIHARQLQDFFDNTGHLPASEFTGGTYVALHTNAQPIKSIATRLNHQIAHMTAKREIDKLKIKGTDRLDLLDAILKEAVHFQSKLEQDLQGLISITYNPANQITAPSSPSPTNQISSTSVVFNPPARSADI